MNKNYRILPPELRGTFPAEWEGFDLRGMKIGQEFIACWRCGLQFDVACSGAAIKSECPNCQGTFSILRVTREDVKAGRNWRQQQQRPEVRALNE